MTSRLLALPALAAALALGVGSARADPRIVTRPYQASGVTTLTGHAGIETTIAFDEDEHVENVAVGNSALWQVTPNKRANLLFVKPTGPRAHTNMTVITDRHTYLFDLVAAAGAAPLYMLRFTYPERPKAAALVAVAPKPEPVAPAPSAPTEVAEAVPAASPPAASPADLNFGWAMSGERRLLPGRVYDDGHATFLWWPRDATLPAILARGPGGQEGPVNFTVKNDTIVVDGVPAQLVLRAGKAMATLTPAPRVPAAPAAPAVALASAGSARP